MGTWGWIGLGVLGAIALLAIYDLLQNKHAILKNFPIVGHFRYWLEAIGPELRQYIVTDNDEERPFSRDERRWVYASSKQQNNYFGFGTDNAFERSPSYLIIKHAVFPAPEPAHEDPLHPIPCAKVWGAARQRPQAFRPDSTVYVSAMSFGSLSAEAVEALNRGCAQAKALHNTGEGGISRHHDHGGDLVWQIGTGYFGCRNADGRFDLEILKDKVQRFPVRALEIKLSQGAKPGRGGVLPAAKVNAEIAEIRGVPAGQACISPSGHAEFRCADSLLDFVERLADATGLPVGIKSAIGETEFWHELARLMETTGRGVDHIQVDGGEGGTGAAPLVFSDHVALPFRMGFARVYRAFAERDLTDKVVFTGSGKLGLPEEALLGFAMGCDMLALARTPMLAIGCIQAQRCHTDHCPTGVATQNAWLRRGLHPQLKSLRVANYLKTLRKEILWLTRACGVSHPAHVTLDHIEFLLDGQEGRPARDVFSYEPHWGRPNVPLP